MADLDAALCLFPRYVALVRRDVPIYILRSLFATLYLLPSSTSYAPVPIAATRYARALFRRAACLLEKGDAVGAIEGFKALYRVDRNWPQLPDWLVRAFSLQKRQAKGYKGGDSGPEAEASGKSTGTAG